MKKVDCILDFSICFLVPNIKLRILSLVSELFTVIFNPQSTQCVHHEFYMLYCIAAVAAYDKAVCKCLIDYTSSCLRVKMLLLCKMQKTICLALNNRPRTSWKWRRQSILGTENVYSKKVRLSLHQVSDQVLNNFCLHHIHNFQLLL